MSEIKELQSKVRLERKAITSGVVYPLTALCGSVGEVVEAIEPDLQFESLPEALKLDLWGFAVAAARLREWAKKIEAGELQIPPGVVMRDVGDIGNRSKQGMGAALAMIAELSESCRVNLLEVTKIATEKTEGGKGADKKKIAE